MEWKAVDEPSIQITKTLCAQNLEYRSGMIKLRPLYFDLFWIPDLYIYNAISDSAVSNTVDMRFLKIRGDNDTNMVTFQYGIKAYAIVDCPMEFPLYPVDIQHCPIKIRSCK